jgi:hypothetical protein
VSEIGLGSLGLSLYSAEDPKPKAQDLLRSKSLPEFTRRYKCLHHLRLDEVAIELIQLRQPEVVSGEIGIRQAVWIASQVTEVLHQYEGSIEFSRG